MRQVIANLLDRLRPTKRFESEMDEEIRFHLKARTEHWIEQGMPPSEAARAARMEFGAQDRYRDEARQTRWLWFIDEIVRDTRYGFRSLTRTLGFTLTIVATLALGIGANTAIFSVVNGIMIRPLPFDEPERLMNLFQYGPTVPLDSPRPRLQPQVNFYRERQRLDSFADIVSFRNSSQFLLGVENPQFLYTGLVSANFCEVLGVRPQVGRCMTQEEEAARAQVVMLSHDLWSRQFGGDPSALGKTITLRGRFGDAQERDLRFTVIGVLPREFEIDLEYALLLPVSHARGYGTPEEAASMEIGRLHDGVTPEQAHAEMLSLQRSLRPNQYEGHGGFTILVMQVMQNVVLRYSQQLLILLGVVSLLLLIACANVANLLLSRGSMRMRELAMRAAAGATRARIVRQLLTESALLSLASGVVGLAAATAGLRGILAVFGERLPRVEAIGLDWRVLAYTGGVSLAGGLLLGLIPALRLSRVDLSGTMKASGAGSVGGWKQQRWMGGLLAAQVALCMVAAIGAGLLINTMIRLRGINRGFDPRGVAIASLDLPQDQTRAGQLVSGILQRARSVPGVSAALIDYHPQQIAGIRIDFRRPGTNDQFGPNASHGVRRVVSDGYFQTMRIPLVRGRDFAPDFSIGQAKEPRSVIVSESLARRYWPGEDPVGRTIVLQTAEQTEALAEIIGVVGDVRSWGTGQPDEFLYLHAAEAGQAPEFLMARASGPSAALMSTMRQAARSIDPNQTLRTSGSFAELVDDEFRRQREVMTLLGWFAGLALVLTAVGVGGQVAYAVGRRKPEIAIRVSCGARPGHLLRMFSAASLRPVATGVVLGAAGALALTKYVETLLFEVTPADPTTFVAAGAVVLAVALTASLAASMKAITVDPAIALRQE